MNTNNLQYFDTTIQIPCFNLGITSTSGEWSSQLEFSGGCHWKTKSRTQNEGYPLNRSTIQRITLHPESPGDPATWPWKRSRAWKINRMEKFEHQNPLSALNLPWEGHPKKGRFHWTHFAKGTQSTCCFSMQLSWGFCRGLWFHHSSEQHLQFWTQVGILLLGCSVAIYYPKNPILRTPKHPCYTGSNPSIGGFKDSYGISFQSFFPVGVGWLGG